MACSLEAGDLARRASTIAEIGAESLIGRRTEPGKHLLRFRASESTRRRLEGIVAAEAECCPFLELALREDGEDLLLSIRASDAGQAIADGLAEAFSAALSPDSQSLARDP